MRTSVFFATGAVVWAALILGGCQKKMQEQDRSAVITSVDGTVEGPSDRKARALRAAQVAYYGQLERLAELSSSAVHWKDEPEHPEKLNNIVSTVMILKYKGLLEKAEDPSFAGVADVENYFMNLAQGERELLRLLEGAYASAGVGRDEQPEYVRARRTVEVFRESALVTDEDVRAAQLAYYGQLDRLGELALALVKLNTIGKGDKIWEDILTQRLISGHMIPLRFRTTDSTDDLKVSAESLEDLAETEAKILEMVERAYLEIGVPVEKQPPYVRDRQPVMVFEVR